MRRSYRSTLLVVVVLIAAVVAVEGTSALTGGKGPVNDPDAGLSDAQRIESHAARRSEFDAKLAAWFAGFDPRSVDLRSLEHHEIMAQLVAPPPTLDDAVAGADTIIVGTVNEVTFDRDGAIVRVSLEQALKGSPSDSVRIRQASGLWPTPDWSGAVIKDAPGDPLLFVGDRVVLLLQQVSSAGADFQLANAAGHYTVDGDGRVVSADSNPFASSVDGQSLQAFVSALAAAVERTR